jgi:hypothetical protein
MLVFRTLSVSQATKVRTRTLARILALCVVTRVPGRIRVLTGNASVLKDVFAGFMNKLAYLSSRNCPQSASLMPLRSHTIELDHTLRLTAYYP